MLRLIAPWQSFVFGWLTELTRTKCSSHCWRLHVDRGTDRKERGRQKDVASASRLSSNWFVVLSEHVRVWLMCIRTQSRQKISRLTDLFLFYYSLQIFVRNLNFALVHSQMELCQSTCVYVEERLYAAWVYYCIRRSRHHPCSLFGPWRLLREW